MAKPDLCLDTLGADRGEPLGLYPCKGELTNPGFRQTYRLRLHRDISLENSNNDCLDSNQGKILLYNCKFMQDNQYFRYDLETKQIICGPKRNNVCMDMDPRLRTVFVSTCNAQKQSQKWTWGFANETMLMNWTEYGKEILDKIELEDLKA